jgi:hypothetical protein
MSEKVNPTLKVLREIRDKLDRHELRLGTLEGQVGLLVEGQARLTTEVVAVADAVRSVADLLRERLDDRNRVDDHERRIRALERKVG